MIPMIIKPYDVTGLEKAVARISEKYGPTSFVPCGEGRYKGYLRKETWVEEGDAPFFNALAEEDLLVSWGVSGGIRPRKETKGE